MSTALAKAVQFTIVTEGGFVTDNGGDTMYGVTQRVYDLYMSKKKWLPVKPVKQITMLEVLEIMGDMYWGPAHCDALPEQLAIAHFDWAYNHGTAGAAKTLQIALGFSAAMADGVIGPKTLAAVAAANVPELVGKYLDVRRTWYKNTALLNPAEYGKYIKGWLNRVDALEKYLAELPLVLVAAK